MESLVKSCSYSALARRMTGTLRIRRIGHHDQHAFIAEVRETPKIRHLAINRRIIQFKVTGMYNHAYRRFNRQAYCIRNRMINADKPDTETADIDNISLHDRMQASGIHAIFFQTSLKNSQSQARPVNRHMDLLQNIRKSANMILMPVRQNDGFNFIPVFQKIADIGNNQINAKHIFFGKHETGVNDQYLIIHPNHGHILSDLAQSPQGNNL